MAGDGARAEALRQAGRESPGPAAHVEHRSRPERLDLREREKARGDLARVPPDEAVVRLCRDGERHRAPDVSVRRLHGARTTAAELLLAH